MRRNGNLNAGRILVVDDEASIRIVLEITLMGTGNTVFSTGEPEEVRELCEKHEIDVVLLDVNLPNISGIEVCQEIRSFDPNIPVIMISGLTDRATCQKTITNGAIDFITKPLDASEVLIRVKNAVQMRRMQRKLSIQLEQFNEMSEAFTELNDNLKDLAFDKKIEEKKNKISDILGDYIWSDTDLDDIDPLEAIYGDHFDSMELNLDTDILRG